MRQEDVVGEPSGAPDPHRSSGGTEMLVPRIAARAGAATEPRVDDPSIADGDAARIGTDRNHLAGDLVSQGMRQIASLRQVETLAAPQVERPFPQMDVAVADAAGADPQEHLLAPRLGQRGLPPLQRAAVRGHLVAQHGWDHPTGPVAGDESSRVARPCRKKVAVPRTTARQPSARNCACRSSGG